MQHSVAVAVGSYTTAVEHCDCDMRDQRVWVALRLVRNMDCATAATDNTRATPLSHHEAMECMRTPRNGTHRHARSNPTNGK